MKLVTSSEPVVRSIGRLCLAVGQAYRGRLASALQLLDEGIALDLAAQVDNIRIILDHLSKARIYQETEQLDLAMLEIEKALNYADSTYPDPRFTIGPLLYTGLLAAGGNSGEAREFIAAWRETSQFGNQLARLSAVQVRRQEIAGQRIQKYTLNEV